MSDPILQSSPGPTPAPAQQTVPATYDSQANPQKAARLRLWPGVVILVLFWTVFATAIWIAPLTEYKFEIQMYGMFFGPMIAMACVLLWWIFASAVRWLDVFLVLLAFAAGAGLHVAFTHPTMVFVVVFLRIFPAVVTAWVGWLLVTQRLSWPVRRMGLCAAIMLAWAVFLLFRSEGVDGQVDYVLKGRWSQSAEASFLAEHQGTADTKEPAASTKPLVLVEGDWPGFRGPNRDGKRPGVRIATDWAQNPPKKLWGHRVGPGWSSFAVVGNYVYTQEQWEDDEAVVCYDATTGDRKWSHKQPGRFFEEMAGPGPRATPTFHDGKIYVLGARGQLQCLDAASGKLFWSRDVVEDSGGSVPIWGFAASPLVVQGVVTVFAGGPDGKAVLGYDTTSATGQLLWSAGKGKWTYCSMQPARLGGVEQLIFSSEHGLTAFHPVRGDILWEYPWPSNDKARVVQPAILDETDLLIGTGFGMGTHRLRVTPKGDTWTVEKQWASTAISPYYNDFVVHKGHIYGFNEAFFTCVNLDKGKQKWAERGYGYGQVLLLPDQDLLVVLSEKGVVALREANPDEHKELGRFQAWVLEPDRKTWNHPVIAHGKLFVRNDAEAACYELKVLDNNNKAAKGP